MNLLPALLVGSGLKHNVAVGELVIHPFSRLYWSGVD